MIRTFLLASVGWLIVSYSVAWEVKSDDPSDTVHLPQLSNEEVVELYVEATLTSEMEYGSHAARGIVKRPTGQVPLLLPLPMDSTEHLGREAVIDLVRNVADEISFRIGKKVFNSLSVEELTNYLKARTEGQSSLPAYEEILVVIGNKSELRVALSKCEQTDVGKAALLTLDRSSVNREHYCVVMSFTDGGKILDQAIFIETDADIEACLFEELMQSTGLTNDFTEGMASIFNDDGVFRLPTYLDWLLLKIHLEDRILSGMTESETRSAAMLIAQDILK